MTIKKSAQPFGVAQKAVSTSRGLLTTADISILCRISQTVANERIMRFNSGVIDEAGLFFTKHSRKPRGAA